MTRLALLPFALLVTACSPTAPAPTPEALVAPTAAAEAIPLTVGVLEERLGATTTEAKRFVVRALFQKQGDGWKSLEPACADQACLATSPASFPAAIDWTVIQAGETRGTVRATTPTAWQLYADVGSQELAAGALPPTVGERTTEFAGDRDEAVYRPLLAVSAPAASDPDTWRAGALAPKSLAAIQSAFRGLFANVLNCANDGGTEAKPMTYKDADIVTSGVSASAKGWTVATAQLTDYRCDGPWDDTAFAPQTFAVSPEGEARYLGEGLKLLDTADFDGDGKSEVVFVMSGGNLGGYDLRFNDFAGQAVFAFNYH